jgi:nucleoside-triphosphatase THEP1
MNKKEIFIVSAPVHSGKTTSLLKFIAAHNDVYGILTPVISEQRVFMDIHTKDVFRMEAQAGEENILLVGKYSFSAEAFNRAASILRSALNVQTGWLILDEIGSLEMRGQGFHDIICEMCSTDSQLKFIFVIRDSFLSDVLAFFRLRDYAEVVVNPPFMKLP